jgi:hypothetical protein
VGPATTAGEIFAYQGNLCEVYFTVPRLYFVFNLEDINNYMKANGVKK